MAPPAKARHRAINESDIVPKHTPKKAPIPVGKPASIVDKIIFLLEDLFILRGVEIAIPPGILCKNIAADR